ncbi:MAG: Gti1/Pac2 family-domain-containing protein [Benniella sp.]|nr:MAG: Gti1/Pac2 family-domain-containing protein [Benniella sp.]
MDNSMETYFGLIKNTHDALIIFEACRLALLTRVHRRLSDIERQGVRSGSVYCFDEREAGMRRWTDGKSWSPSRVTGSFLTYRELDDSQGNHTGKNAYRDKGLYKQSFSITTTDNQKLHLISYYTNDDINLGRVGNTPSQDPQFAHIVIPKGIYPETATSSAEAAAPAASQSSPSPPLANRAKPRTDDTASLRVDAKPSIGHQRHRRNESASSVHSLGHRRANSGSLKDHRYSPIQTSDGKHVASRSRSNSNLSIQDQPYGRRFKSSSPGAMSISTPPNGYSPAWVPDEDHAVVDGMVGVAPAMIPALRELPPIHYSHDNRLKDRAINAHEQDSLSVLANLATHNMMLPKLEPKEISREKIRWVEDDRQLRALSSMLRL